MSCCCNWVCCPNILLPPEVIYLTLTTISQVCGCLDGQIIPMLPSGTIEGRFHYRAIWLWTCPNLLFPNQVTWFRFGTFCESGDSFPRIRVRAIEQFSTDPEPDQGDGRWGNIYYYDKDAGQCDPFYFHYTGIPDGNPVWQRCQDDFQDQPEIQMELTL